MSGNSSMSGGSMEGGGIEHVLIGRAKSVSAWVQERPVWLITLLLILISLAKSGITVWNWFELSPKLLTEWSTPVSAFQSNVLFNLLGTAWAGSGLDPTSFGWLLLQVGITVVAFVVLSALLLRRSGPEQGYLPLAIALSTGIATVAWREIGRYDALFIIGIALACLAASPALRWLGVAIASLSSPEQLLVASLLLLAISPLEPFRQWRSNAWRLLGGAILVLAAVQIWFTAAGRPHDTRIGVLIPFIAGEPIAAATAYDPKQGFVQFTIEKAMVALSAGPSLIWSFMGVATLLLLLIALALGSWGKILYLVAVTLIAPIVISTVVGEDRTRDIVLITAPVILAIVIIGSRMLVALINRLPGPQLHWVTWAAILATCIPLTYFYLYAEEPFHWLKELVIALNNGVPMELDGSAR